MSQLEFLSEVKHGRDAGDVVGLEVFCIASVDISGPGGNS
jgi:hypothetical protein